MFTSRSPLVSALEPNTAFLGMISDFDDVLMRKHVGIIKRPNSRLAETDVVNQQELHHLTTGVLELRQVSKYLLCSILGDSVAVVACTGPLIIAHIQIPSLARDCF
jgi:hypothetical protein